jgi:hypothetical protein
MSPGSGVVGERAAPGSLWRLTAGSISLDFPRQPKFRRPSPQFHKQFPASIDSQLGDGDRTTMPARDLPLRGE